MDWSPRPYSAYVDPSLRTRVGGALAAAVPVLLILLMLLGLAPALLGPPPAKRGPLTFELTPDAASEPSPTRATVRTRAAQQEKAQPKPPAPATPKPAAPKTEVETSDTLLGVLALSREELETTDRAMRTVRPRATQSAAADAGPSGGGAAGSAATVGVGPNGEKLYAAQWYRGEPTDAEMSPYMPKTGPARGWAMIACRTVADYRVEDCVELGESQPGAGFARAMRRAAWQFKVRPPRVGGKTMVGEWVQIRLDIGTRRAGG